MFLEGRTRIVSLTQYYTATTLDGFIADPDNSLDWLFTRKREHDGPLNYGEFIAEVGAMAMGSTTYEWILDHEFADGGVEVALRHSVLGLHAPAAAGRARLGNRVHERGRRNRAQGDGRRRR
jgi:dihydrofolate reductase